MYKIMIDNELYSYLIEISEKLNIKVNDIIELLILKFYEILNEE